MGKWRILDKCHLADHSYLIISGSLLSLSVLGIIAFFLVSKSSDSALDTNCVISSGALINENDIGSGFAKMFDNKLNEVPDKGVIGGAVNYESDFLGGRSVGYIARVAVNGPDRPAEDEYAKSLGYPVSQWPYVPLVGSVVTHASSPLEIYETTMSYSNSTSADAWNNRIHQSQISAGAVSVTGNFLPEYALVTKSILGPNDGKHEGLIDVVLRIGDSVLRIDVQGSPRISLGDAEPVISAAIKKFTAACVS